MTTAHPLVLVLAALTGWLPSPHLPASAPLERAAELTRGIPPALAQTQRSRMRRAITKINRMPKHTKVILGLCAAGVIVFFIGIWAKSRV